MSSKSSFNVPLFPLDSSRSNRRSFIGGSASLLVALASTRAFGLAGVIREMPSFVAYPFQLGVASGDPTSDGFVLWTRLAPNPLAGGGLGDDSLRVHWQVAEDEAMTRVVAQGAEVACPDWAHSLHVEVAGLKPDRWYWYQFKAGHEISPLGRTRTLAAAGTNPANTSNLKMTFASCQHFEAGHYTAYEHMLSETPDLVFHLGDYIYEGPGRDRQVRLHQEKEIHSLADYRNRHAQYKCDRALQAMHAAAPWVVTWDDHEFDNNYAAGISEQADADPAAFLKRRAAAYQAYYEHMPLRKKSIPNGPHMQLYRTVQHGGLVNFHVLDTRQFRTDQPNGDGTKDPGSEALNPNATILGKDQRDWLFHELKSSHARWNVLSQQVMMARVDRSPGPAVTCSMDQWAGYEVDRQAVLQAFLDLKVANPLVITGDIHSHWANDLTLAPAADRPQVVGAEFVGTSISSAGDGLAKPANHEGILSENPEVKFYNAQRGYVSCEIGPHLWRTNFQNIAYITRPGAALETTASFVVENGKPGLQRA